MSDDLTQKLNDLISVLRGGAQFYREAAEKVSDAGLASRFKDNAVKREAAASELASAVSASGSEPATGSWAEKTRSWYASALAVFQDTDATMIAQLEEHEDRTIEALRDAMAQSGADAERVRPILASQLAVFEDTHAQMRALKGAA